MTLERLGRAAAVALALWCLPVGTAAQACEVPDSIRRLVPSEPPTDVPYATTRVTGADGAMIPLGVGHLHYSYENAPVDLPPGADDWLLRLVLPLSVGLGEAPSAWIAGGWILEPDGGTEPLARLGLVETGYEDVSFVVLETGPEGWLRIRYASEGGAAEEAWTQRCYLTSDSVVLDFTAWSDWLLSGEISPLFFRSEAPGALYAGPSADAAPLAEIADDYILEPLEIRGEWMRVTVREPSDYCDFEVESTQREGWVRWHAAEPGPLLWYFTRGC